VTTAALPDRTLRGRFRQWIALRSPVADTWTLTQRNVYIVPTKGGVAFALTLLLMLLASINYQLNLGYVLTFLLAGSGAVAMHLTHGTLRGLTLRLRAAPPVFAGEPALVEVVFTSPGSVRHGIALRFADRGANAGMAFCDVPALGQTSARVGFVPARRGWHAVPPLVVETGFPFGLFRAWTVWRPAGQVLAWPRPEQPAAALPGSSPAPGERAAARQQHGSELDGVRAWRRGDGLRQVVWKKVAKSGEMVSRETAGSGTRELWLDWAAAAAAGSDAEQRLSRLAAWVLQAESAGLAYGLRLPGREMAPGQGDAHKRAALEMLALWS
jgi:uncharacterized protein (DUF58 family)